MGAPVEEVGGVHFHACQLADDAFAEQLLGGGPAGAVAALMAERHLDAAAFAGLVHLERFAVGGRHRLFRVDEFGRVGGGGDVEHDRAVELGPEAHGDDVQLLLFKHFMVVRVDFLEAEVVFKTLRRRFVDVRAGGENDTVPRRLVACCMRPAATAATNDTDS